MNADGYVYLGANLDLLGYNLFAYCSNNPTGSIDPGGHFALSFALVLKVVLIVAAGMATAATVHDIVQIGRETVDVPEENISSKDKGDKTDDVKINNSYRIFTPWVQYGYCFWLNHINKNTKDVIDGTSIGMTFEWSLHNVAYVGSSLIGDQATADSAKDVNLGKTIFSDNHGGFIEYGMKHAYMFLYPFGAMYDYYINGGYQ